MSQVFPVLDEGSLYAGIMTSGQIPERFLKRDMDRLTLNALITRGETAFMSMLHTRIPKSKIIKQTREHSIVEMEEFDRVINVTGASVGSNNHTTFSVGNFQAPLLEQNDILFIKNLFCHVKTENLYTGQVTAANVGVNPRGLASQGGRPLSVHYSNTFGQDPSDPDVFFTLYEQVKVVSVGAAGSGINADNTLITVQRCYTGPSAFDIGGENLNSRYLSLINAGILANSESGKIQVGMELLAGLNSFPTGSGAPDGRGKTAEIFNNFTQEFKYAMSIENEAEIEATNLNKSQWDINKMLQARRMSLHMERTYLFGRKSKIQTPTGSLIYTMGGAIEYVPQTKDHIITYDSGAITYTNLLNTLEKVFKLGGSMNYDAYCGIGLYIELKKAFYSSGYMRYSPEASKSFDIPIETLEAAGGRINIIPCYTMSESGWDTRAFLMDQSKPHFVPVTHEGWDMKYTPNIAQAGYEIRKELYVGIKGLERRYASYLAILDFRL